MSRRHRRKAAVQPSQRPATTVRTEPAEDASSVVTSAGAAHAPVAIPHDPGLPDQAVALWQAGDWVALARLGGDALQHHPNRGELAAYRATAAQLAGDHHLARSLARHALDWGCTREQLARLLLAGSRVTLARASYFARRERQTAAHLERAFPGARMSSELRRLAVAHTEQLALRVEKARQGQAVLRKAGAHSADVDAPPWLKRLASQCLQAEDPHELIDDALANSLGLPDDRVRFLLLLADGFLNSGDRMTAQHFLSLAANETTGTDIGADLRPALMKRMVALNASSSAVQVALASALQQLESSTASEAVDAMRLAFERMRDVALAAQEHGHELMLNHLKAHWAAVKALAGGRRLTLIEIGTTREEVPGQGSTRKIAEFCKQHGLHFITVDMDPHNSRMARELFAGMGMVDFEAVTMKGEDYLRERKQPIDIVFLDAYDFDHGMHSALRQSRYERFMGSPIDEQACHQMHLDCARSVADKLWAHGLVCVDDTWRDGGGGWTAKGTLAVPYLLAQGFELLDERNRAVLMARGRGAA